MKKGRKFSKQVENTEGKGEIAHYLQFLLYPQCVQKPSTVNTKPFPKQALVFMCRQYKSFENSVGKGEIARN